MAEFHRRSLIKGITWRITGTLGTIVISYFFTQDLAITFSIASTEAVSKIFIYYLHERAWNKFTWGRPKSMATIQKET